MNLNLSGDPRAVVDCLQSQAWPLIGLGLYLALVGANPVSCPSSRATMER